MVPVSQRRANSCCPGPAVCRVLTAFTHGWTRPLLFANYRLVVNPGSGKNKNAAGRAGRRGAANCRVCRSEVPSEEIE